MMDRSENGVDLKNEYGFDLSIDDILAEFQLSAVPEPVLEPVAPVSAAPEPVLEPVTPVSAAPEPERDDDDVESFWNFGPAYRQDPSFDPDGDLDGDGVRVYRPRSAVAALEDEARSYMADLAASGFEGLRDEAAYERGAGPEDEDEQASGREPAPRRRGQDRGGRKGGGLAALFGRAKAPGGSRRGKARSARPEEEPEEPSAKPEEEASYEDYVPSDRDEAASYEDYAPSAQDEAPSYGDYVPPVQDEAPSYEDYQDRVPDEIEPEPDPWDRYSWLRDLNFDEPEEPSAQPGQAPQAEPEAGQDLDFDPRFHMTASAVEPETAFPQAGDGEPAAPEETYRDAQDYRTLEDGEAPEEEPVEKPRRGSRAGRDRRKDRRRARGARKADAEADTGSDAGEAPGEYYGAYSDRDGQGSYAPAGDYDTAPEPPEDYIPGAFPSFRDYLASLLNGFLLRLRGFSGSDSTSTMVVDSREDLGQEVSAAAASKYYGSFVHSLRLRLRIALVLLAIMIYLSLGLPVPGMLQSVRVSAGMCLAIQLTILLLGLDQVTGAVMNLCRRRLGADGLALLACLLTSVDALAVFRDLFGSLHRPLCALSSLSFCGVMLSALLSARGLRKSLRVPAIGKRIYTVSGETGIKGRARDITLLKSTRPPVGFVRRSEEAAPDETAFIRFSPLLLAGVLVLAIVAAAVSKRLGDLLYIVSAVLSPAVPVTALLGFALPFFVGSVRIFSSGAAIAGWSGLCDIGQSRNLIVTDRDLFPEGSVELQSVRIFADEDAEKVISYAGTMMVASGCGVASCFGALMEKHGCSLRQVENFEFLSGGGMQGVIEGETVLCGSSDLMRLMNVRIPFRLVEKTSVLLAIDGILYGIFNMNYTPLPAVRKALVGLMRSNRHPVFAIRDFNVTPEMLHNSFDIATDGYDFPPYVERFAIDQAQPSEKSKVAAVVCREGLGPLTHMADTGRSMYLTVRLNILLTLLGAVAGMVTVCVKLAAGAVVSPAFLLLFMLAWALPVGVLSLFLRF